MSFLSPLFLAGAAAAVVPIVLHFLRLHTDERVRFPAVALLKGAPVEHLSRRRLRELLLLALRVAALVLLALAFARPFFRAAGTTGGRLTVVAIDNSLSMSAPSQLARARRLADETIRSAPAGDEVAVVTFAGSADVAVRPTSDRGLATAAVRAVSPGFGSTRYTAGLAAAARLFSGRSGTIVVVTDMQASGWDAGDRAAVPESVRVDVKDVGALKDNLAIVSVRAEGDRIIASIQNGGERTRDAHVRLTVDGRAAGNTTVPVGARSSTEAVFTNAGPAGIAVATVDDPGGAPGDDTRYAIPGRGGAPALVVTTKGDLDKEAWYVRHALADVRGVAAADVGGLSDETIGRAGAVVVLSTRGLERRGREHLAAYVNAGGGLLIAAGPDVDAGVAADLFGSGTPLVITTPAPRAESLAPADVRHPIFRSFGAEVASLGLVRFREAARISAPRCQPIAKFTSGEAAMLDCAVGNGRGLMVASDLNNRWNDFPIRASFVPFLDQAVRYLSGSGRGAEYLVDEVPPGVPPVPGAATVTISGASRRVVVNADPKESEFDRMSQADFEASVTRLKDTAAQDVRTDIVERESRQHLWQYLLAAMIVALVGESIVANRMA